MCAVTVLLDEEQYGQPLKKPWRWRFYCINPRTGKREHITVSDQEDKPESIIAVTREQYKNWAGKKIFVEPR